MPGTIDLDKQKALMKTRDKILKRFLTYSIPDSVQDIQIKRVPKNAYPVYPYFCIDGRYLYFPAIPGADGVVLGKFKSAIYADYLVKLLIPDAYQSINTLGSAMAEGYKFVLNLAYLGSIPVYDGAKDNDPNSPLYSDSPSGKLGFYSSLVKDLNLLALVHASLLKEDPSVVEGTFIGDFVDLDAVVEVTQRNETMIVPFIKPIPLPLNKGISPYITNETSDQLDSYHKKSTLKSGSIQVDEVYVGLRHYSMYSKLYGKFMKDNGYNINKAVVGESISTGQLLKFIKLLLKDFKGTDPLMLRVQNNLDTLEEHLVRLSRLHITMGNTAAKNTGLGMEISAFYGWEIINQTFDPAARNNPKIRIIVPKEFARFMVNRSRSMKALISKMPNQKVKEFIILMYYPILSVYMNFFQLVGPSGDFPYEKFSKYMGDWFIDVNATRGAFKFLPDKNNFYKRAERLIKNFK